MNSQWTQRMSTDRNKDVWKKPEIQNVADVNKHQNFGVEAVVPSQQLHVSQDFL